MNRILTALALLLLPAAALAQQPRTSTVQQIPESQIPRIGKRAGVTLRFSARAGMFLSRPDSKVRLSVQREGASADAVVTTNAKIIANLASTSFRSREIAALGGVGPLTARASIEYFTPKGPRTEHVELGTIDYSAHQSRNISLEEIDYVKQSASRP